MAVNWNRFHFRPMKLDDLPLMHRWVTRMSTAAWKRRFPDKKRFAADGLREERLQSNRISERLGFDAARDLGNEFLF